jgi:hypothetical protein
MREGDTDVADLELVTGQPVPEHCVLRAGRTPALSDDEEGVLERCLNSNLKQRIGHRENLRDVIF